MRFIKLIGPGIIWLALAQGSGELIWWPYLVAKYGVVFLPLMIPAALLQYPLTYALGYYTAITGKTIWRGYVERFPRFTVFLWILMVISFLWFGAFASAGATALSYLFDFPGGWDEKSKTYLWSYASIAVFFSIMLFSKKVYRFIEVFMWFVSIGTFTGLLITALNSTVIHNLSEFINGFFKFRGLFEGLYSIDFGDYSKVLTAIAFLGLGGFWTLFYSYWIKEKNVELNKSDCRKFVLLDSGIGVAGNLITTFLTCLLAYSILRPKGLVPEGFKIAVYQSEFFAVLWGGAGRAVFLIITALFLIDTWLATADAFARVNTDIIFSYGLNRNKPEKWWYTRILILITVVTCITLPVAQPGVLIVLSAVIGFSGTVVFSFLTLILGFNLTGSINKILLLISSTVYLVIFLFYIYFELFI